MELTPAQSLIAKDTHRFRVVNAGRRFGKSTLISWEMFALAVSQDDARIPYYAPTRDDARDIMWGMLKKVCEPLIYDINEGRLEIAIRNKFGGLSHMFLYGWEAVQERGKGVGVKNNHIYLDEVSKYRGFWQGWHEVLRPTLTDLKGGATFISTPNGFNHFYDLCNLETQDEDYKSFHFTSYDNPFLDKEELDKAKKELTEDRFAQEYLADFRKTEGLVFKEFSRDRHLYDERPPGRYEKYAGIDFGFRNPAAVIPGYFDGENLYIEEEWYKRERTDAQIADYVATCRFKAVFPDPENAGGIEELRRRGVNTREVRKGKGSIESGVNMMKEMFLRGNLFINRKCINLIAELESYSYDDEKSEVNENEKPIKKNDHAIDASRYMIMSLLPIITRQEMIRMMPRYEQKAKPNPAR